jgi:hypothetical protein
VLKIMWERRIRVIVIPHHHITTNPFCGFYKEEYDINQIVE